MCVSRTCPAGSYLRAFNTRALTYKRIAAHMPLFHSVDVWLSSIPLVSTVQDLCVECVRLVKFKCSLRVVTNFKMTQICPVCQKECKSKSALEIHARTEHHQFFQCPKCPKKITYLKNFAKHYVDARHGSAQDAKAAQKGLQPQYTMMDSDTEEGMYNLV